MLREDEIPIPSGCAISGIMNQRGEVFSSENIIESIALMHDRSNGLGGGFAAYGIYPEYADHQAFHVFYEGLGAKERTENYLISLYHVAESARRSRKILPIGGLQSVYLDSPWAFYNK